MHEAGTEAGGQKIKPCLPHLLSCSGGAGISLSKEVCVYVYVHVGEWFPPWCVLHLGVRNKNTLETEDVTNKPQTQTHTRFLQKAVVFPLQSFDLTPV